MNMSIALLRTPYSQWSCEDKSKKPAFRFSNVYVAVTYLPALQKAWYFMKINDTQSNHCGVLVSGDFLHPYNFFSRLHLRFRSSTTQNPP